MRKNLIAVLVTLGLGSAAVIGVIATNAAAQAPATHNPVLLAQAAPPNAGRAGNGRAFNRPLPGPADRTARRAEFCQEAYARATGRFAYLEARLGLTGMQTAAFARWRGLRLATAKRRAGECAARPNAAPGRGARAGNMPPNPVERLTRQETMLQRRVADIQAERPALEALYTSLSATQRQTLARGRGGFGMRPRPGDGNMMFRRQGMMGKPANRMNGGRRGPGMMPPPGGQPPPAR